MSSERKTREGEKKRARFWYTNVIHERKRKNTKWYKKEDGKKSTTVHWQRTISWWPILFTNYNNNNPTVIECRNSSGGKRIGSVVIFTKTAIATKFPLNNQYGRTKKKKILFENVNDFTHAIDSTSPLRAISYVCHTLMVRGFDVISLQKPLLIVTNVQTACVLTGKKSTKREKKTNEVCICFNVNWRHASSILYCRKRRRKMKEQKNP